MYCPMSSAYFEATPSHFQYFESVSNYFTYIAKVITLQPIAFFLPNNPFNDGPNE